MATLLLGAAGGLLGGALFGPIGAVAGRALGALGGAVLDQTLLGGNRSSTVEGPRLTDLDVMASTQGAAIPRVYGRARLSGQVIWATRLFEVKKTETQSVGGKGGSLAPKVSTVTYTYYGNFAVALCAGPVSRIGRIWADGKLMEQAGITVRRYLGAHDQSPDPWIVAKQGDVGAPAYRGIAYLVFENLDLTDYGNRLPQITAEVERGVGALEPQVRAVTLIPGATEFGYDTVNTLQMYGQASYGREARHVSTHATDFVASVDQLLAACPNLERVSLVVSWFGDDLRAGACLVRPKCERHNKTTVPQSWSVGGLSRLMVPAVSQYDGRAAYGGTPSDLSIVRAITRLKEAGVKVTLNPFVMMDIPADNTLPDPWTGAAAQPPHPWRGRITCDPAPGRAGTVEGTAACGAQVGALFGSAEPGDFLRVGSLVLFTGTAEWSLRRMVLHYAHLAVAAGGVEAILIGSEMEALTRLRDGSGGFPAVTELIALAADVKAVVGPETLVSYGANWAEYGSQVYDGNEVRFPLDTLWASPDVDFIGIDYYPPFTDWRDGTAHLDASLAASLHDRAYLKASLRSGEAYDWYYVDDAARLAQSRSPITDGAYDEAWIYRQKDLWSWWANPHHERFAGVRAASPTAYVPGAKPIRLMEAGCAAVDKGPNLPSAFPDPKSSENALPPFSSGQRDDLVQRRMLEAILATFEPAAGASLTDNPQAPLYGGRMVDEGCVFLWTWDARPYPQFPLLDDVWGDGSNWTAGHWLTGRLGSAPLDGLVAQLCADFGVGDVESAGLAGVVEGYVVEQPMTARAALEPLARAFAFEAREADGQIAFHQRGEGAITDLAADDLVQPDDGALLSLTRTQETELPLEVSVGFIDPLHDYRKATVSSRRLVGQSRHVTQADLALVAAPNVMVRAADVWLQDLWAGRESVSFSLLPSRAALMPGDLVRLTLDGRARLLEITRVEEAEARAITARSIEPDVFDTALEGLDSGSVALPAVSGPPAVVVLDLPALAASDPLPLQYLAAAASPWPGTLAVWRSSDGESFDAVGPITASATLGTLAGELPPGPLWRFDRFNTVLVTLETSLLVSASATQVLEGANVLALLADGRDPEIIQFTEAELVDTSTYRLSGLLRGRAGTEAAGTEPWPEGTRVVRLDGTLVTVASGLSALGRSSIYRVGAASGDYGDEDVSEVTATATDAAFRPLSPVHVRGRRTEAGVVLSFIRRTRMDGDSWEAVEVPLGEDAEAYRVEILSDAAVVRTLNTATPSVIYASADELADFGAVQASLTVRVCQLSATVGAGTAATRTLAL
ncbi:MULTISPECIES: baseplate multidomain protein megatron [unclassified Xanthobacter]|uniref:baseplate multidomain protein megatron n=1 Tax=unclassified Xanthobacter TaxID=2623496 RepID=UPI001EDF4DF3|nr:MULTISPECIES: glycoside hydrolase/phage tail family protein [unclassified Xanthobacter]